MYAFERGCKDDIVFAYFETFAYFDMVHYSNVCEYAVICIHQNIFFGEIQEFFCLCRDFIVMQVYFDQNVDTYIEIHRCVCVQICARVRV